MANLTQAFTLPENKSQAAQLTAAGWALPPIKSKHSHVNSAFRFLDLPAEMRNLVYRELLVWPSDRPERCWPQILRTCRQISYEATDIIYTENAAKVEVEIENGGLEDSDHIFWWVAYMGGRKFDNGNDRIENYFSETLREYDFRCSPFLLRQASIQVDIRLQGDDSDGHPEDVAIILSRVVYTLSSAFLHCKKLEKLSVRFYGLELEVGDQFGPKILWSLSKLRLPATALSIEGLHTSKTTNWPEILTYFDPGSPVDIMPRLYRAHVGSQHLEKSLYLNEPAIKIVSQAAYDEGDRPVRDCQDIYREEYISLTFYILDREEEKCLIESTERLELWVKTTIQALERDAEVAKARIDAVTHKVRKVAGLLEI
ncbi:hypothetical protein KC343_g6230 [Hortaea werneckii]|uniref:F-box domain-containing protein n=1 Tax=Hortaea werneckii TaxID=91943 RepID=A0A3M7HK19_HORWE|nr:hypothetical protein KC352_g8619 [Hortaea werneckii]KAI7565683.1 hypothetical protein KC317_g6197 [Hortaea werneckii]KAI7616850.1 hypothetical protein KC346_g5789 [Hortaea werneckii]KAI7626673.1 hypothetical protein KC343_g6230 [Hortaea werneckii]KAI7677700.1 hypothetical protein KC319_g3752 [Hortaea werneckii]